jgi:hypothetical protein
MARGSRDDEGMRAACRWQNGATGRVGSFRTLSLHSELAGSPRRVGFDMRWPYENMDQSGDLRSVGARLEKFSPFADKNWTGKGCWGAK